jgi:hypothetical protein
MQAPTTPGIRLRPRLAPLAAAAVIVAAGLLALDLWLADAPAHGLPLESVLAHERDDHGYVVHTVSNFRPGNSAAIVLVGTSSLREALAAPRIMADSLEKALGQPVAYANLSTFDQSLAESFLLISNLALPPGSTLVLEVKPRRFTPEETELEAAYNSPRLAGLDEAALHTLLARLHLSLTPAPRVWRSRSALSHYVQGRLSAPVRQSIQQLTTLRCGWSCIQSVFGESWWRSPRRYLPFAYPDTSLDLAELERRSSRIVGERVPRFARNEQASAAIAAAIVDWAATHRVKLVLLELPTHRLSREAYAPVRSAYAGIIQRLVAGGVSYVDWSTHPSFGDADFFDLDHLRPAGRRKLTAMFLELMQRMDAGGTVPQGLEGGSPA